MGFGFSRYDDCCDFDDGYGDGPCGGYYCYREKCRHDHKRDRDDGCCDEHDRGKGCNDGHGHGKGCCDGHDRGRGCCDERNHDRGCCDERCRDRDCCRNKFDFPGCGCFPFGYGPGWHNTRYGMFLNIPFGGCNMGFFMPFK